LAELAAKTIAPELIVETLLRQATAAGLRNPALQIQQSENSIDFVLAVEPDGKRKMEIWMKEV
jgi:hypothetical protein